MRYKSHMSREMSAQPELAPGFETTMDVEHHMEVVPLVPKPEERFSSSYTTDVSVQVGFCHLDTPFYVSLKFT